MTRRAPLAVLGVLLGAVLGVLGLAAPAQAADHTVTLATSGPSPSAVTVAVGDTVTFKAADANTYHVRRTGGSWTFTATVTRSRPVTTKAFGSAGTYQYAMTFDTLIGEAPPQGGSVVVPTPAPSPTASSRPSTASSPSPAARPTRARPSPTAVAPTSGVAVPPPISGAVIPTPAATPSAGPAPQVAVPVPSASSSPSPAPQVEYADPATITQGSPHGLGLPSALAVVAVVGVVSLLVRFLLAVPEAKRSAGAGVR